LATIFLPSHHLGQSSSSFWLSGRRLPLRSKRVFVVKTCWPKQVSPLFLWGAQGKLNSTQCWLKCLAPVDLWSVRSEWVFHTVLAIQLAKLLPRLSRRQLHVRTLTIRSHLRQFCVIQLECLSICTMVEWLKVASLFQLPECRSVPFVSPFFKSVFIVRKGSGNLKFRL